MPKVGTVANFKKGQVVQVERKSSRSWSDVPENNLWCKATPATLAAWYASPESKGMDDAGETKLPPQSTYRASNEGELFRVVRARVTARRGWADISGCAEVEDADGNLWFVERKYMS